MDPSQNPYVTPTPTSSGALPPQLTPPAPGPDALLARQAAAGANWFYWIAGLSLVNSLSMLIGANFHFVLGLGITLIATVIANEAAANQQGPMLLPKVIALLVTVVAAAFFLAMGKFAHARHAWAFVIGMVVYAVDGLFFVAFQDWISVAFHGFALFCLFKGLSAAWQWRAHQAGLSATALGMTTQDPRFP